MYLTHVTIETRHTGRGELTITEIPLTRAAEEPGLKSDSKANATITGLLVSNRTREG
jgi:hypothetical protein